MKINRFVALAALALLVIAAMGAVSVRAWAQGSHPSAQSQDCAADQADDATEDQSEEVDTDTAEMECGDQNEAEGQEGSEGQAGNETVDGDTSPSGTPALTAAEAQTIADAHANAGTATLVELDEENGKLIYSVEFGNGSEVEVDAMTGAILGTGSVED